MRDFKRERPSFPAWGVSSPHCAASEAGTPGLCQASRAHASPCLPTRCFLPCFSGRARTGRITVWNTRIAAHRTTAHFFRHPHPPRAGVVLVLIQYHATRPGGIAAPPSPAPCTGYAPEPCGYAPAQLVLSCSELRASCVPVVCRLCVA